MEGGLFVLLAKAALDLHGVSSDGAVAVKVVEARDELDRSAEVTPVKATDLERGFPVD